jgi:hypothetical protein
MMFVDPCVIMMLMITIIYTGAIRTLGTKQKRSKVVAGSANQYNIAPTQPILSLRFFEPKLRRIILILTLLLTIQSRNLTSNTDRVTILAIYTSLKMKRRNSITALYKWLIRRRTKIWHDLLLGVWTLTHWRTQRQGADQPTPPSEMPPIAPQRRPFRPHFTCLYRLVLTRSCEPE